MGHSEFRGGQHVSVYVARAWGDAIVATWVETQGGAAVSGARGGAGIGNDALRDVRLGEKRTCAVHRPCPLRAKSGH